MTGNIIKTYDIYQSIIFVFDFCICSCEISLFLRWDSIKSKFFVQDMGADELSECVQDFYQNLSERLQAQFKGATVHSRRLGCKQWLSPVT